MSYIFLVSLQVEEEGGGGVEEGGEEEEQERRPPPAHTPVSYSVKGEGRRDIGIMCYVV